MMVSSEISDDFSGDIEKRSLNLRFGYNCQPYNLLIIKFLHIANALLHPSEIDPVKILSVLCLHHEGRGS